MALMGAGAGNKEKRPDVRTNARGTLSVHSVVLSRPPFSSIANTCRLGVLPFGTFIDTPNPCVPLLWRPLCRI